MKPYFISLGVGVFVGVIYALLHTRSPAPPVAAIAAGAIAAGVGFALAGFYCIAAPIATILAVLIIYGKRDAAPA